MLLFNLYHLHFQLEGLRSDFFGFPDRRRKSFLHKRLINKIINFAFNVSSVMVTPSVESTLYTDCEKLVSHHASLTPSARLSNTKVETTCLIFWTISSRFLKFFRRCLPNRPCKDLLWAQRDET